MEDSSLLGPVIKTWFKANSWPQSVSEGLARAKGWTAGPWASQISICMAGRLTPKPAFFVAMGMFNEAVAERDFIGVTDRRLMDRLKAGQPICHEDGVPWNAMDFFGCYIGEIKPPSSLTEEQRILTQEDADHFCSELRESFRELVLNAMDPGGPAAVWNKVAEKSIQLGLAPEDAEFAQEIISGFRAEIAVETQIRLKNKYPCCPLIKGMQQVAAEQGASKDRLAKFYEWHQKLHSRPI